MVERRIGCAGWSIRSDQKNLFAEGASHLARYAAVFNAVEINSSFYRPHLRKTYERWCDTVPEKFQFAVKLPKTLTHAGRLQETAGINEFLEQVAGLRHKLGPILVQLPPSLKFDASAAGKFFDYFRQHYQGWLVCEPRHASWFEEDANEMLRWLKIARVAADPATCSPKASEPGGFADIVYYRLHGSPRIYYSAYEDSYLESLANNTGRSDAAVWCIFDNTAHGAAVQNALALSKNLQSLNLRSAPTRALKC